VLLIGTQVTVRNSIGSTPTVQAHAGEQVQTAREMTPQSYATGMPKLFLFGPAATGRFCDHELEFDPGRDWSG